MKILVIGGTGMIGTKVTAKLLKEGHEVVVGVPDQGVDLLSGKGLAEALHETDIVIDLSNSSSPEEENAIKFFTTAGHNLLTAEKVASVKHHVLLSIVGTDRAQYIGYLRAKKTQEDIAKASGIPFTIIRSTQFHEHVSTIVAQQSNENGVQVSTLDYQPIAADDVATFVAKIALDPPKNDIVEIAGPERAPMTDFVGRYLHTTGDSKIVVPNDDNIYMSYVLPKSGLVPLGEFRPGRITFDEWASN